MALEFIGYRHHINHSLLMKLNRACNTVFTNSVVLRFLFRPESSTQMRTVAKFEIYTRNSFIECIMLGPVFYYVE